MVDPRSLGDLPPDRFGAVVTAVLRDVWGGVVDVSPPSPTGTVEAVVEDGARLVHVRQATRLAEDAVRDVTTIASERDFGAVTLATTGLVSEGARDVAEVAGVSIVDGEEFAGLVAAADVDVAESGPPAPTDLASQFAGHWPGALRDRAVEAAATVDGVADFDVDVTRASGLTDVDFRHAPGSVPVARLRFTETSLLVYVRGEDGFESIVRRSAYRDSQPPLPESLADRVRAALGREPG